MNKDLYQTVLDSLTSWSNRLALPNTPTTTDADIKSDVDAAVEAFLKLRNSEDTKSEDNADGAEQSSAA